jgi:hypothetical protein
LSPADERGGQVEQGLAAAGPSLQKIFISVRQTELCCEPQIEFLGFSFPDVGMEEQAMLTKLFWSQALERATKTFAQSAILAVGASKGANLFTLDWQNCLGFALGGFVLSILTSVASYGPTGDPNGPSLVATK